jgi:hypothetical protein
VEEGSGEGPIEAGPSDLLTPRVERHATGRREYTSEVVTHAARACSRYSAGFGPVSVRSRIAGSSASRVKASVREVSSAHAA